MRTTPRARCCRAGAGSSATALHAKRRSIDCMILGSERCDWIRSDAQVGCLVALCQESTPKMQRANAKLQSQRPGRAKRKLPPRQRSVGPRYDCDRATGQRNHIKPWGQPTNPNDRRPRQQCVPAPRRAPGGAHASPKTPPTLSLVRGASAAPRRLRCARIERRRLTQGRNRRAHAPLHPRRPVRRARGSLRTETSAPGRAAENPIWARP